MWDSRTANIVGAVARVALGVLGFVAVIYTLIFTLDGGGSALNFISYFTILSNILGAAVLVATGLMPLAKRPAWWDQLRGAATLYMGTTGIIYNTLLLNVDVGVLTPWANNVLHRVMPVVMIVDWLIAPPRQHIGRRTALLWLVFPILYCVYSLVRGPFADFYPYPFLDPRLDGGYGRVAIYIVVVALVIFGLALFVAWIGNRMSARRGQAVSASR